MASISSAGIGSGLDVNSIISQLMAIEKQPLVALQTKETAIQSTVSEYGKIKSAVSALRDVAAKLGGTTGWNQTLATSSNSAVGASSNSAASGSYSVEVQALASTQTVAMATPVPLTTKPGSGTLRIELGTWSNAQKNFTAKPGATAIDISIASSDTLVEVRDKVNAAGAGVTALIMTDAAGSRLVFRSNETGAGNAFRTSGISSLTFDPSKGGTKLVQTQAAADAAATINGLDVTSSSNSLTTVIEGLTLNLTAVTTAPVIVNVAADTVAMKKTISEFAEAYSAVVKLIAADTKYDPVAKKGAILQGDSAATGIQRQLRTLAGSASSASTAFGHLSDIGLELQADGSMTVNATRLDSALANVAELKKMFSASSATNPALDGFGKRFRVLADSMIGIGGAITSRTDGLGQRLQRNQKDQDAMELRLAAIEKRYRAQYTALDTAMARISTQSAYITQQVAAWSANSRG